MIIKDTKGDRLKLTKTRLTELENHISQYPFHVTKESLNGALADNYRFDNYRFGLVVEGHDEGGNYNSVRTFFIPKECKLGCRTFSQEIFNKIFSTMGLKLSKINTKTKKKGASKKK